MNLEHYDLESLRRAVEKGTGFKFLFFWGHTGRHDRVGQECLSQWYPSPFSVDGVSFSTAEHYMMFRKALLFDDRDTGERVLAAPSPGEAKALGRSVRGFDEALWQRRRMEIVVAGNLAKFTQSDELRGFLLATGSRVLVEASPVDRIWGIGLAATDAHAANPTKWRGLNLLGFALMDVRDRLRKGAGDK